MISKLVDLGQSKPYSVTLTWKLAWFSKFFQFESIWFF